MAKFFMADDGELFSAGEYLRLETDTNVVVIPEADWRRLVELVKWVFPGCECEGLCDACREDREIKAIIQRTEEANDA